MSSHDDLLNRCKHPQLKAHVVMADISFALVLLTKLLLLWNAVRLMLRWEADPFMLILQTLFAVVLILRCPYWLETGDKKLNAQIVTLLIFNLLSLALCALPFIH